MSDKNFQEQNWIFRTGVILIVFWSIVTGVLNFGVLYLFGIPLLGLLLGIIFVWFAKANVKTKILLTFLPIPIILSIFFLLLEINKAEPETFLIPQNFRGQFEIVFNEPCGHTILYEKGRRIYQIPDNGVLITNAKQTFGVIDRKFYSVDENGNQAELPEFHWNRFEEEKGDWHWTFSRTKLSNDLVGVMNNPGIINYLIFTVSDYQSLEKESKDIKEEKRKSFQEVIDALLKECRKTR